MMKSDEIAKAFLHEMNPTNWNGQGGMPAGFDARTLEFITDMPDVLLDIPLNFVWKITAHSSGNTAVNSCRKALTP